MGGVLSSLTGAGTYTVLGDTDGFFSVYLRQPSDSKSSLFRKWATAFKESLQKSSIALFPAKLSREAGPMPDSIAIIPLEAAERLEESCSEMLLDCLETTATFAFQQVPASSRFSRQIHFKAMVMSRIGKIILKTYFEFSKRTFLSFIILTLTTPLPRANLITSSLEFLHFFNQCVRHC